MRFRFALGSVATCLALSGVAVLQASAQTGAAQPETPQPAVNRRPFDHIGNVADDEAKKGRVSKVDALTIKQSAGDSKKRDAPGGSGPRDAGVQKKGERAAGGGYLKLPDIEGETGKVRPAPSARSDVRSEAKKGPPKDEPARRLGAAPAQPISSGSDRPEGGQPTQRRSSEKRSMFELQKANDELKQLGDPDSRTSKPITGATQPGRGGAGAANKGSQGKGTVQDNELRRLGGTLKAPAERLGARREARPSRP